MRLIFLLSLIAAVSCNRPTTPTKETPTPAGSDPEMRSIYPHSDEFKRSHGKFSSSYRVQCLNCHGSDGSGGSAKVACTTCHTYPHPPGWALPGLHGTNFLASKDAKKDCLGCHFRGESVKDRSCKNCHQAYPHDFPEDEGFKSGNHNVIAKTYAGKCLICHTDFKKHMGGTGCTECHSGKFKEIEFPLAEPGAHNFKSRLERVPTSR
jgi:hypothetical protein